MKKIILFSFLCLVACVSKYQKLSVNEKVQYIEKYIGSKNVCIMQGMMKNFEEFNILAKQAMSLEGRSLTFNDYYNEFQVRENCIKKFKELNNMTDFEGFMKTVNFQEDLSESDIIKNVYGKIYFLLLKKNISLRDTDKKILEKEIDSENLKKEYDEFYNKTFSNVLSLQFLYNNIKSVNAEISSKMKKLELKEIQKKFGKNKKICKKDYMEFLLMPQNSYYMDKNCIYYSDGYINIIQVLNKGILATSNQNRYGTYFNGKTIFIETKKDFVDNDTYVGYLMYSGTYDYFTFLGSKKVWKFKEVNLNKYPFSID